MDDVMKTMKPAAKNEKLELIMTRLGELAARQNKQQQGADAAAETLADDAALKAKQQALIQQQEALVRPVLALFGISYDSLISMDGKSLYAQAVQARPELLQQMLTSEQPVLAALQVALGYKPFAEFGARYGTSPEEIKKAMRAELMNELGLPNGKPEDNLPGAGGSAFVAATPAGGEPSAPAPVPTRVGGAVGGGSVFTKVSGQRVAPKKRTGTLDDVFGR